MGVGRVQPRCSGFREEKWIFRGVADFRHLWVHGGSGSPEGMLEPGLGRQRSRSGDTPPPRFFKSLGRLEVGAVVGWFLIRGSSDPDLS